MATPELSISDHYPLLLPIPCEVQHEAFTMRQLKVEDLEDEEWEDYDSQTRELMASAEVHLQEQRKKEMRTTST